MLLVVIDIWVLIGVLKKFFDYMVSYIMFIYIKL